MKEETKAATTTTISVVAAKAEIKKVAKILIHALAASSGTNPKVKTSICQNLNPLLVAIPVAILTRSQESHRNDTTTHILLISPRAKAQCLPDPGLKIRKK
jgi:hypothetical protein